MKILKDNYTEIISEQTSDYPKNMTCEGCSSELEYDESDFKIGTYGCYYVYCPLCGEGNLIEEKEGIKLTFDNVEFPTHYWHTCKENGAVDMCNNKKINEWLKQAFAYFKENKDEFSWWTQTGNLRVEVHKFDGDKYYEILVTNNFYTTEIEFEHDDY